MQMKSTDLMAKIEPSGRNSNQKIPFYQARVPYNFLLRRLIAAKMTFVYSMFASFSKRPFS